MSAGMPNVCCTMIARVRGVTLSSRSRVSIPKSARSTSTYTGCAPNATMGKGTAMQVNACSTTSSPLPIPNAFRNSYRATRPR